MTSLPIVDFAPFLTGDQDQRKEVADAMRKASESLGFFMLKNVGIPTEEVNKAFHKAKEFFNLPVAEKQKISWLSAQSNRGYIGYKRETLDPSQKSDLKEAFNLGTQRAELDSTDPAKNKWPENQPEFKADMEAFITQCTELANSVLEALAIALNLDEEYFTQAHNQEQHTFRLLHYPPLAEHEGKQHDEKRAGAHTDYGSITLLFQDDIGGLEVKTKTGDWVAATPVADTIVVNIGDLMQRWTNDVFTSNPHRVTQPEHSRYKDRYSMAYFCTSNKMHIVESIRTCVTAQNPKKYPAISTQDHMLERLNRTY